MEIKPEQYKVFLSIIGREVHNFHFTLEELAVFVDEPIRELRRLVASGKGPPKCKQGRRFVYPAISTVHWVERRRIKLILEEGGLPNHWCVQFDECPNSGLRAKRMWRPSYGLGGHAVSNR